MGSAPRPTYPCPSRQDASRRDRVAALDLDEAVPGWVARTYDIQMSQAYRVR